MEETLIVTEISAKGCLNRGTTFRSGYAYLNSHTTLYTLSLLLKIKYMGFLWARSVEMYLNGCVQCIYFSTLSHYLDWWHSELILDFNFEWFNNQWTLSGQHNQPETVHQVWHVELARVWCRGKLGPHGRLGCWLHIFTTNKFFK